jgi:hypothetical protein
MQNPFSLKPLAAPEIARGMIYIVGMLEGFLDRLS